MRKTLFLNPPSFEGFDGGAGSRYQARREIRSFWYPTWLAQPAALLPDSRLIDAPADGLSAAQVLEIAGDYEMTIIHTSTPSFRNDVHLAEQLKQVRPDMRIGMVGPHVAVLPQETLSASPAVDFVARKEYDYALKEIAEGRPVSDVGGVSWRLDERVIHNPERAPIVDMDALPFVIDVYKRDLTIENYFIGYLLHPYVSLYTGRGCPARCTFCLWPHTIGGHKYRTRSPASVEAEMQRAKAYFPQVKEFFFDDDTFTADLPRTEEIARRLGKLGVTWSCNARANVPFDTLKVMKENGLRLLLVGYESGSQNILDNVKKGIRLDVARSFTQNCKKLGIVIHGTFVLGLPGESRQSIEETIRFACDIDPNTIQVSLAAPYPGTELYAQALAEGWMAPEELVDSAGIQSCALSYPDLPGREIFEAVERFYRRFYFRPRVMARMAKTMILDSEMRRRRLREGVEFLAFLRRRKSGA
jgi:hopanoid biosynthesis associated radical SAM protein HpnJ